MTSEDQLVAGLREICAGAAPHNVVLGIGDDAAVWRPSRSNLSVITTDALVEDVHFRRSFMSARDIGYRALAANLSDIAAMGARPILATIALGVPGTGDDDWIYECYRGMAEIAGPANCALAGGDITRAPAIVIVITVVGEVRTSNLKRRSGARTGDVIAVTGPLGASRAGLGILRDFAAQAEDARFVEVVRAFRRPQPRLAEGRWLGASTNVHALMDCSDGLSTDVARLCTASGRGATIEHVPVHPGVAAAAALGADDPLAYALDGGEDYELIAAIDARAFSYLAARFAGRFGRPLERVGTVESEMGLRDPGGMPLIAAGWDHLRP